MPGTLVKKTWQFDPTADAPAAFRRACRYEAFVPDELPSLELQLDTRLAGLVSEAERAIRQLNDEGGAVLAPLARMLLRTESIASSKVEGMQVGVRELARAEARIESGITPGSAAREILSNIDAMTVAMDEAAEAPEFRIEEILSVHRRLMERAPHRHIAGRFRDGQNWIGGNDYNPCGADFVPPPRDEVDRLMQDVVASINDDLLPPVVQAALVHAQFETIHPFDVGNGRAGRALIHVVLRRRGIAPHFVPPISVVFAADKQRYINGLTRFRGDDVVGWVEQFTAAAARSAQLARAYVAAVGQLQERWRQQLRETRDAPRAGAAAWAIIDVLPAHPMISGPVAAVVVGRAKSRIYEAFDQLIAAGVLVPVSEGRRNRWWEAQGLLDLVSQLESGQLPPR
jgi:Fic family protein